MAVVVILRPDQVVTLDQAKRQCRVDTDDDDVLIAALVDAATETIDGPAGTLGRAIGVQTLELRQDGFVHYDYARYSRSAFCHHDAWGRIPLPFPPVTSIVSITYDDTNGVRQTLDPATYALKDGAACLAYGASWPAYRSGPESVAVQFIAGYEIVPAPILAAILLRVGDLYVNREARVIDSSRVTMIENTTADLLLSPFRVWGA